MATTPSLSANRLLARLTASENQRLSPLFEFVQLKPKHIIYHARAPLDYVYFPAGGIISAMTVMEDGRAIEVATIGNEGVAGLSAFIGGEISPYEVMVQVPGGGWRMSAVEFRKEASRAGSLRDSLVRYHTAFGMQVSYAVACNGLHTIEKRCCRWLLMTQDRVGSNILPLTHEFLAIMLGVRRASVTEVLHPLQEKGLLRNQRGHIEVLDRAGLESSCCECYGAVNRAFDEAFK